VFHGEGNGDFSAYAADDGRKLWSISTGSSIQSVPVTFIAKGSQYVVIPVGLGSMSRNFDSPSAMATPEVKRGPSRLLAFKLGATMPFPYPKVVVPAVPKPPAQTASAEVVRAGARLFDTYTCSNCHSHEADGSGAWIEEGAIPDLRYMPQAVHEQFLGIVLGGSHRDEGMPGFADGIQNYPIVSAKMSLEDAQAIHAYIVDVQWKAYEADRKRGAPVATGSKPGATPH
jgi:mono/diheme cytochrome c family protein